MRKKSNDKVREIGQGRPLFNERKGHPLPMVQKDTSEATEKSFISFLETGSFLWNVRYSIRNTQRPLLLQYRVCVEVRTIYVGDLQ